MKFTAIKYGWLYIMVLFCAVGCYSFKGISIPDGMQDFYVEEVKLNTLDAPPNITYTFRETLRSKVRNQSRLTWDEENPDAEFLCTIMNYSITTEAAREGNTAALNKLTITVSAEYINNQNEDDTWKKNFSYSIPFDPTIDIQTNQDAFIADIFDQITEQIFNEAFAQW